MKSPLLLASTLLMALTLSIALPITYAQDYTQWGLPEGATARLGKGKILSVQFSPDGTRLSVASGIGIWTYNTQTGKEISLFPIDMSSGERAAFSPDGHILASDYNSDYNRRVRLWDVQTRKPHQTGIKYMNEGNGGSIKSVSFSPDGTVLATVQICSMVIRLSDVRTGSLRHQIFTGHTHWIQSTAFSPNNRMLASGSHDNTVRLWNVSSGQPLKTLTGHTGGVHSVVFSPDGNTLASGSRDRTVRLWDAHTGQHRQTLTGHTDWVFNVVFSPDGNTLASGSRDGTIRLWDVRTGVLRQTLTGHTSWVNSVSFSPDGLMLASESRDGTVRLWDVRTGVLRQTLTGHTGWVSSVVFSSDGTTLASGSYDDTVRLWDVGTGVLRQTLIGHTREVTSVVFSSDGTTPVSGSVDGTIRLWDVSSGQPFKTLTGHMGGVYSVVFSPDGHTLASGSDDDTVRLWDVETGVLRQTLTGHTNNVNSIVFSPDGSTLASGSHDDTIRLWDVETGVLRQTLTGHTDYIYSVAFSADGSTLASAGRDNAIRLWNVGTGVLRQTLMGHTSWVNSVVFSADGNTLASGSWNGEIRLWDVETGVLRQTLTGHTTSAVRSLSFSIGGNILTSGRADGTILLWDVTPFISQQPQSDSQQHPRDIVRLVYFRPSDRTTQPNVDININGLIKGVQDFYTQQMHRYGRKTFTFETDADGNAVVHHVNGQFTDAYYQNRTYDKVREEISKQFDTSKHVYLVAIDVSSERVNHGNQGQVCGISGGGSVIPASGACFNVGITAHELGHTFGLEHDFRDDAYLMGYGGQTRLSEDAAEWLSVHPYFNANSTGLDQNTTLEVISSRTSRLKFQVTDADGLHQAQLLIPATPNDPAPGVKLHSAQTLDGKTSTTVDFVVSEFTGSPEVTLQVIDVHGNIIKQTFSVQWDGIVHEDVNRDGIVNILDLALVASNFGQTGQMTADVNGDGVVNIADLVKVAGMLGNVAAAPSMGNKSSYAELQALGILTAADVQLWLTQAQHLNMTDATSQGGILFLEQLLATLIPKETVLLPNYPNPFNPETWIPYQLSKPASVIISIYSAEGKLVRTLAFGHQSVGIYESRSRAAYWDGRNNLGESVASGVYFYTLSAGEFTATRKMLIRK